MKYPARFRATALSQPDRELEVLFDGPKSGSVAHVKNIKYYTVGEYMTSWISHENTGMWELVDPNTWVDGFGIRHNKIKGETT